jgi:hypothetical protein
MSRTKRNVPYKHYWGYTKKEKKRDWEEARDTPKYTWMDKSYVDRLERNYLLHGTESRNYSYPTREYFNQAHRVGRRVARDQLRPHVIMGENFDFDDSRYYRKYKGVWWDIY